jgi:SAM-dependent methyltransferase
MVTLRRVVRRRLVGFALAVMRPFERLVLINRYVAGKYVSLDRPWNGALAVSGRATDRAGSDGFPVPPEHLWLQYGRTADEYLVSGRDDVDVMLRLLKSAGAAPDGLGDVLDVGCGAGRMLRAFPRDDRRELWGVDISAPHIEWCESHLSPPLRFATTTSLPHLPFEDATFDLVWCGSVFTHISELATAWLLELRRIVRPRGWIYVTVHTKHSLDLLAGRFADDPLNGAFARWITGIRATRDFRSSSDLQLIIGADPISQVFYDADGIAGRWSHLCSVVSVTEEAHDYQAAVVLRKR